MPLTDQPVKGMYIKEGSRIFLLQDRQLKTQGRQGGLIIMKMKALDNGQVLSKTIKAGVKVEHVIPETKEMQYLYSDNDNVYFMDMESFETIPLTKEIIGDYVDFLKEGSVVLVVKSEGKVLTIKENPVVELEVTEALDAVKGNTSNSATKEVTTETGFKLQVPMFIKKGEVIKINTESKSYSGKAN
jgi:elongation factor P